MGMPNPERDDGGVASTKEERDAIMSVAERYILSVGIPGFRRVGVDELT
jgi:hypothetical protein